MPEFGPVFIGVLVFAGATMLGVGPVRKVIQIREARHELKQGSAGYLRTLAGWSVIAFWIMATWFAATIIGDWAVSGDLNGAFERSGQRLRILLRIAAAIGSSDN